MRILANENFPRQVIDALQAAGIDVLWVRTACPGITDPEVLTLAVAQERLLVTFDKDFGELAVKAKLPATCGVILFRIPLRDLSAACTLIVATLLSRTDWAGHFSVIDERRIRMRPLDPRGDVAHG